MIARLWSRILALAGRGRVTLVDDSGPAQLLQVRMGGDEIIDGLPRLAEYGLTSNPPDDTDAIALFIAGERSNGVVIATSHQTWRVKNLGRGDVALYDNRGRTVVLSDSGIAVDAADGDLTLTGQNVNILGVLNINGSPYLAHTHSIPTGSSGPVIP